MTGACELFPAGCDGYFVGFHLYEHACTDPHERTVEMLYMGEVWGPPS